MSFSLARLNMIIVITRSPFDVKSIRDLASPILIPKLTNTGQQIFRDP
jgi:hypothetical protein